MMETLLQIFVVILVAVINGLFIGWIGSKFLWKAYCIMNDLDKNGQKRSGLDE